jgi:hypothetical protein
MSEQDARSSEPPRSKSIVRTAPRADASATRRQRGQKGRTGHRGRPSRDDYRQQVASIVRADVWDLDKFSVFGSYPGVRTLMARYEHEYLPLGVALKLLLDRAVTDVIQATGMACSGNSARVATFLRRWYLEDKTVVAIAAEFGLHRTHVVAAIQRPSLALVADRFLALAEQVDPPVAQTPISHDFASISRMRSA